MSNIVTIRQKSKGSTITTGGSSILNTNFALSVALFFENPTEYTNLFAKWRIKSFTVTFIPRKMDGSYEGHQAFAMVPTTEAASITGLTDVLPQSRMAGPAPASRILSFTFKPENPKEFEWRDASDNYEDINLLHVLEGATTSTQYGELYYDATIQFKDIRA